jgi:EAL domain-containing protein (putative c-di-GMP-specific phosphodiesterase class I)
VGLAIDDFGVGYSSLSYLDRFELDVLKIDQSFVRRGEGDSRQKALCEAIISMGHHLGLAVVAEGIETAAQQRFLVDAGCDFGQGYLLGRPMPLEDLLGAFERQGPPFPVEAGSR